jgi:hypothetical protein
MNKIMNLTTKNWAACALMNIWTQLVSNLEEVQRSYKRNFANKQFKEQSSFKIEDQV